MEPDEVMRELTELLPTLKAMVEDYKARLAARQAPYRPYDRIFSVRLNSALIDGIKALAESHDKSYSAVVTEALSEYLRREEG